MIRLASSPRAAWLGLATLLCLSPLLVRLAPEPLQAQARPLPQFEVLAFRNQMIPMRDGVRLAADVYRPALAGAAVEGKFPVILERTPYGKSRMASVANYFTPRGYAVVAEDVRGRYQSEGRWFPLRDDPNDGFDTAQWIGSQPWCDGGIGTVGTSYDGGVQHAMAIANAPYLKTMIPVDSMSNFGRYGVRHNGAFETALVQLGIHPGRVDVTRAPSALRAGAGHRVPLSWISRPTCVNTCAACPCAPEPRPSNSRPITKPGWSKP